MRLHGVNELTSVFLETNQKCCMRYVQYSATDLKQLSKKFTKLSENPWESGLCTRNVVMQVVRNYKSSFRLATVA